MNIEIINEREIFSLKEDIIDFLYKNLDDYKDSKIDISKALEYSLEKGGLVLFAREDTEIKGIVLTNETGMSGYIPENIIVYIAVEKKSRGQGIGKELILKTIELLDGDIALHVEHDNPARNLYERIGFRSKYLEMRYHKR